MLLIALSLRPGFPLPYERGPAWYGLSADSTEKGLLVRAATGQTDGKEEGGDQMSGARPSRPPLFTLRTLVILLAAALFGLGAGWLTYLGSPHPA